MTKKKVRQYINVKVDPAFYVRVERQAVAHRRKVQPFVQILVEDAIEALESRERAALEALTSVVE